MIALDFQTGWIRSLRLRNQRLVARSCRLCCIVLEDRVAHREALERLQVAFATCEDGLVVIGDAAARYADLFKAELRELLPGGLLPVDDPPMRQVLRVVVDAVLPDCPGEIRASCCVATPSEPLSRGNTVANRAEHTVRWLSQLAHLKGYDLTFLPAGQALVLAELVGHKFSGLGIEIGRYRSAASLLSQGKPLAEWTSGIGLESRAEYGDQLRCRTESRPTTQLIDDLLEDLQEQMQRTLLSEHQIGQPVAVVVAGEATDRPEFVDLWRERVARTRFPFELGTLRSVADKFAVCRGCLINDQLEQSAVASPRRAA